MSQVLNDLGRKLPTYLLDPIKKIEESFCWSRVASKRNQQVSIGSSIASCCKFFLKLRMEVAARGLKLQAWTMKYCCQVAEVLSVAMIVQEGKPQIERAFLICLEEQGMHQMHEITTRESHAFRCMDLEEVKSQPMTYWLGRSCTVWTGLFMAPPEEKSGRLNVDLLMKSHWVGVRFPRRSRKREQIGQVVLPTTLALTTEGELVEKIEIQLVSMRMAACQTCKYWHPTSLK